MGQREAAYSPTGGGRKRDPTEHGVLLKVGTDIYPVYGNDELGWSIEGGGLQPITVEFRYSSLEELFFVLVNFSVSEEGHA